MSHHVDRRTAIEDGRIDLHDLFVRTRAAGSDALFGVAASRPGRRSPSGATRRSAASAASGIL